VNDALFALGKVLVYIAIFYALWFFFFRETEEDKERKRELQRQRDAERDRQEKERREQEERDRQRREAERAERERQKARAKEEFDILVSQGMPKSVARAHRDYIADNPLPRGSNWYGEDVSPLTYYGYRVGKTRGLRENERRDIMHYVLRARLTDPLAKSYQSSWGRPLSQQRRNAIVGHINKLAAQRGNRKGYEVAVAEWSADGRWAKTELAKDTAKFGQYGFK